MSILRFEFRLSIGQTIQIRQGDLTREDCDAIVNAANSDLEHGGGVAGAIVRQGGKVIQDESEEWIRGHGPVPTGQVAVTRAGALACKWVIHAVGPIWNGGNANEEALLAQAVRNSLEKAEELNLESIALPAISSGIYRFPKERCAEIMVRAALEFYREHAPSSLRTIRLTNIDELTVDLFTRALRNTARI